MRKLFFAAAALTCSALCLWSPCGAVDQGNTAPTFSLPGLGGGTVDLSSLKGKVVYLDFWASWCGPCKHTLPWMESLQKKFGARGLQVVAVNVDSEASTASDALAAIAPSYTVALDPQKSAVAKYAPPKMPTSFLIDKSGQVAFVHPGFHDGDQAEIEQKIDELLGK